ncbi:glycosyltransferase [Anoxynatronum sibiricum]|uniref:Glycosyltransferase n=2 Tax=Anoxynatronum sibiricum TaxID=210623 RepID=A0ABU9VUE4_9CLOT
MKDVLLYGASTLGQAAQKYIDKTKFNVVGFIDSDSKKHGTYIDGLMIRSIDKIEEIRSKPDIILTSQHAEEILREVRNRKITNKAYVFECNMNFYNPDRFSYRITDTSKLEIKIKINDIIKQAMILIEKGDNDEAGKILDKQIQQLIHPDILLLRANLSNSIEERIKYINDAMDLFHLERISLSSDDSKMTSFDKLKASDESLIFCKTNEADIEVSKVTVLFPVYNAEDTIETALRSIMNQTWNNIEILVVDDCSEDHSVSIIKRLSKIDGRITLIELKKNQGTYVALNEGLLNATGKYVTCHGADDWSHPQKIELQANHLINNRQVVANTSQSVRTNNDLSFGKFNGKPIFLEQNTSSLMFDREIVLNEIGFWDSVRFSADSEMLKRLRSSFRIDQIEDLETGPLSLTRILDTSLTCRTNIGLGHKTGIKSQARVEYHESYTNYHFKGQSLKYEYPIRTRKFNVPQILLPENDNLDLDIVLISDFTKEGTINVKLLQKFSGKGEKKLNIGLVQSTPYGLLNGLRKISNEIRDFMNSYRNYRMVVKGEVVRTKICIIADIPDKAIFAEMRPEIVTHKTIILENKNCICDDLNEQMLS